MDDAEDPRPLTPVSVGDSTRNVTLVEGEDNVVSNVVRGAVLGDIGLRYDMEGSKSLEYLGGWFAASLVPGIDAPADIRDCLVINRDFASNALDCGGAAISTAGSIGTVVGTIGSPTGLGAALAGGSFAVDTAEDVIDAATITARFVEHSPRSAVAVGEFVAKRFDGRLGNVVKGVTNRLAPDLAAKFSQGVARGKLTSAGLDRDTARTLATVVARGDASADEVEESNRENER